MSAGPQAAAPPPVYAAPPQQTNVIVQQSHARPEVPCLDDNNPIGAMGCDKRAPASCGMKCCCAPCVYTNYEGLTLVSILIWATSWFAGWGWFYVCCCWQEPIMGIHYGKKTVVVQQGGVQGPVVVHAGDESSDDDYEE